MKRIFEPLLICFAAALLFAANSAVADENVSKSDYKIAISNSLKNKIYSPFEEVVLNGVSVPEKEIIIFLDDKIALSESDKNGNWEINLGLLSEGKHNLQLITDNSSNSRAVAAMQIIVETHSKLKFFTYLTASLGSIFDFNAPKKVDLYSRVNSPILQEFSK